MSTLTPKERLFQSLEGKSVDRPPCICPGGMMNMITRELVEAAGGNFEQSHHDGAMMAQLAEAVFTEGCFENYGVPFCMTIESEAFGADVDFGTEIHEPHVVRYAIESVVQWRELPQINFETGREKVVLDALTLLKEKQGDVPIIGNITGPISTASSVMEPVVFYKELRKKNAEAHEMMQFVTEQTLAFALKQLEAGAEVIALSDPSGTGEILGPKLFEEFAVPYINQIVDGVRAAGGKTIVHICGQMRSAYGVAQQIHSDALSFDSIVNMKEAKEHLPGRVLMGNVSTYAIEFSEPDKIADLTRKCLQDGVDILSPACGLGMKSPLKNVRAILGAIRESVE